MRIYGSSPLYNYVDLIFRCKRMFIVSILLGTLITSLVVYSRSATYTATILVALSGDPYTASKLSTGKKDDPSEAAIRRKANYLVLWLNRTPEFLEEVVKNTNLDRTYPGGLEEAVKDIRKKVSQPSILNGQYMELSITWRDPDEAEKILQEIYSSYARKTVSQETSSVTNYRLTLEQQFKKYDSEFQKQALRRAAFLRDNYWVNANISQSQAALETVDRAIIDRQLQLNEAQTRLAEVEKQLQKTPQYINEAKGDVIQYKDPTLALVTQRTELDNKMKQLLQRYSELHPQVVELKKQINALDEQIEQAKKAKPVRETVQENNRKILNPEYQELSRTRSQLLLLISGVKRQLAGMTENKNKAESRVRELPHKSLAWKKIEEEYLLISEMRDGLKKQLAAARMEEERDQMTQARSLALVVPPKAQQLDRGSKSLLLYMLGPILGIIIAFCFSLLAEALDHTLRTPVEVEKYLGKPVLAVLPRIRPEREGRKRLAGASNPSITS